MPADVAAAPTTLRTPWSRRPLGALVIIVVGTFGNQALTLVSGIIAARVLGVDGRGETALVVAIATLLAQVTLGGGLPVALTRLLSRDRLPARAAVRPLVARWAWQSVLVGLVAAGYLLWALRVVDPGPRFALAALAVVLTVQLVSTRLVAAMLQGELASAARLVAGALMLQVPYTLGMVGVAVVVGHGRASAVAVVGVQVVASAVGLVAASRLLRSTPRERPAGRLDRAELRRESRTNHVAAVGAVDSLGIDRNLVGALQGTGPLGLYTAATAFANLSTVVGVAVSSLLLPRLSTLDGDRGARRDLLRRWLPATVTLIALMVVALEVVIGPVLRLAFGAEFTPALACARWLVVADGLLGFRRVLTSVLQAEGRGGTASRIELAMTVVLVALLVVVSLHDSLVGVGISLAVVGVLSCAALGFCAARPARRTARARGGRHRR